VLYDSVEVNKVENIMEILIHRYHSRFFPKRGSKTKNDLAAGILKTCQVVSSSASDHNLD
jgi:hypothetical protein